MGRGEVGTPGEGLGKELREENTGFPDALPVRHPIDLVAFPGSRSLFPCNAHRPSSFLQDPPPQIRLSVLRTPERHVPK